MPHFTTQDRQLVIALLAAGCRFAPQTDEDGGPALNLYTPDTLRDRRVLPPLRPDGTSATSIADFEAAAKLAYERCIPGIVTYILERDDTLEEALKAWDGMAKEMDAAKKNNRAPVPPPVSAAAVMQVMYARRMIEQELKAHEPAFANMYRLSVSKVARQNEKETTGSGKIWSPNLSPENRRKLGI